MVRPNQVNSMAAILSMIADYGFQMKQITLLEETEDSVEFELVICGDINTIKPFESTVIKLKKII